MKPQISVVIPCLNEEKSLPAVLENVRSAFSASPYTFEVIVADNGSTDATARVAGENGARVVSIRKRGYGAAIMGGVSDANGSIIVFGDADGTYDFKQSVAMVKRLLRGDVTMVIGNRFGGTIEKGAMPFLHRYVGTPLLSNLINVLFRARISDCNSGLRVVQKERLLQWSPSSPGMEFASEMIIHCLRSGDRIAEVPISLGRDARGRIPHLSRWRDGMRHLLVILSRAPHGFTLVGTLLLVCSLGLAVPSIFIGPVRIGRAEIFDVHSLILSILFGFIGCQSICYGLLLDVTSARRMKMNQALLQIDEVLLFKIVNGLLLAVVGFVSFIIATWFRRGFNNLHYARVSLALLYAVVVFGTLGLGVFMAQIYRRVQPPAAAKPSDEPE